MRYEECVEYLYNIPRFSKKAPLAQTEKFLEGLGVDLSARMPKIVHVAGTNGKGSVCAYMDAILRAEGNCTGLFTSPHLVRPEERIRINGAVVSEEFFVRCFEEVYPVAKAMERDGAGHPAFFSFLLGMAMVAFSDRSFAGEAMAPRRTDPGDETALSENKGENVLKKAALNYIILETGMGGRLDNTNVFRRPALTVITRIGLDHTQYLGDTREAIAAEKAGILKPGVPVVYLEDPVSAPVIEQRAKELACPCRKVDTESLSILEKSSEGIRFLITNMEGETTARKSGAGEAYQIPFVADYQVENAALAIRAAKELGCSGKAVREGLKKACWPGRMQEVGDGFYVDGAHNVDGVRALLRGLESLINRWSGRRILLFGAVREKDYEEMYRELVDTYRPDLVLLTGLKTPRGVPAEELERLAVGKESAKQRKNVKVFRSSREALEFACGEKKADDFLLCTGSLYLVGEVLEWR